MSERRDERKKTAGVSLALLAEGIRGVSYRPEHLRERKTTNSTVLLRSTNIQGGRLNFDDVQIVPSWLVSIEQRARPQDLAVCMSNGSRALVGKAAVFGDEAASTDLTVGAFCAIFRAKRAIDSRYLKQVFDSHLFKAQVDGVLAGSAINNLNVGQVLKFTVPLPDPDEQYRIADLLSAMDEQMEVHQARISKLREIRSGVVYEKLLPASATATTVTLVSLCEQVTSGSRGWAGYYSDKGALFLRIGNLTREHPNLRFDDVVRVQVPTGGEGARTRLKEGDLLISITADLGIVGSVPPGLGEAYVNQHIALARLSAPDAIPRWVAHVLASPYGSAQIARLNDGGAKAGLNLPTIRALRIPLPPMDQQLRIIGLLDSIDAQLVAEQAHLEKLQLQKRGLMSKLLVPST